MSPVIITSDNLAAQLQKLGIIIPGATDYGAAAYRTYPVAASYTYEASGLIVNPDNMPAFDGQTGSYLIKNRNFNQRASGKNVLAEIYVPSGAPVTLQQCVFASPEELNMVFLANDSDITLDRCIFIGTGNQAPGTPRARAIYGYALRNVKVKNCYFLNTAGCLLATWSNQATATQTVSWLNNRYDNICGGSSGTDSLRQALQLQHVIRPGIEIGYNQITNTPGASRVEDIFNFGESGGTSDSWLKIHDNMLDGAFPANPTDSGFTGSGITSDAGSADDSSANMPSFILGERNRIIRTMNAAMNIAAGHDILYQNNRIVVCGVSQAGARYNGVNNAVAIFKGQNYNDDQFKNNAIINNSINVNTANGEQPYYVNSANSNWGPGTQALIAGNTLNTYSLTATYADEVAEIEAWKADLNTKKIVVGLP